MSQTLSAGITRDRAFELLNEHNKDPFHITHGETVEGTMRYFAREFDPENEEFWGIVGLLHDLDFERYPDQHCIQSQEIMRERDLDERLIRATASHGYGITVDIQPPPQGKDYNDCLCMRLGLPITKRGERNKER